MYKLKLIKGLSYIVGTSEGETVKFTQEHPVVEVSDETAEMLLEDEDRFQVLSAEGTLVSDGENGAEFIVGDGGEHTAELTDEVTPEYTGKTLEEMTKAELETFATYENVSLKGLKTKEAMIEKLCAELPPEKVTGIISYGSPTMVDIQSK